MEENVDSALERYLRKIDAWTQAIQADLLEIKRLLLALDERSARIERKIDLMLDKTASLDLAERRGGETRH